MGVNAQTGIKSIQRGVIAFAAGDTSKTATVSAVNVAKSELRFLGTMPASDFPTIMGGIQLTNSTTITATRKYGPTYLSDVAWELTEWY